jgi:hypothetical protein
MENSKSNKTLGILAVGCPILGIVVAVVMFMGSDAEWAQFGKGDGAAAAMFTFAKMMYSLFALVISCIIGAILSGLGIYVNPRGYRSWPTAGLVLNVGLFIFALAIFTRISG